MARAMVRRLGPNHYSIKINAGKDPVTGKRIRLNRRFRGNPAEADKEAERLETLVNQGGYQHEQTKLSEYLDAYIALHGPNLAPSTLATYKAIIDNHIKPSLGNVKLGKLMPDMIDSYYVEKLDTLKRRSVEQHHSVLHRALKQAVRKGLIVKNPAASASPPKPEKQTTNTLNMEQTVKLLKMFSGHKYEELYITAAFTGMRLGELLALRWDDLSLPKIYVRRSLTRVNGENVFRSPKSNKARGIVAPQVVVDAINSIERKGELVFCDSKGNPLNRSVVSRGFTSIARASGYDVRFHDLRHSFATQLFELGEHPKVVQETLGHHDVAFTINRYTHAIDGMMDRVADRFNQYLDGTKKAQNINGVSGQKESESPTTP